MVVTKLFKSVKLQYRHITDIMKTDTRIRYHSASYVELPAPVSVKNESGARKWIGGAFNKRKTTVKGGINGIKSSSAQPFNINGNVLVTNSGIWNYIQKVSSGKNPNAQDQAFLQKVPMLDITHTNNNNTKSSDKTENDKNKEKTFSHKDDAMRDVLQAKIFKLQFESEVNQ